MITKQDEIDAKKYLRETPEEDQAFGWVSDGKLMRGGAFRFMPLLAWIVDPPKVESAESRIADPELAKIDAVVNPHQTRIITRKLAVSGALLKMAEDVSVGMLDWALPITENMVPRIADVLATFGWDQRVWPDDAGWPDETPDREGFIGLMMKRRLNATLTFPPGPNGNRVMTVNVLKVSSPFPLPPVLVEEDRVIASPELVEKFRSLTAGLF